MEIKEIASKLVDYCRKGEWAKAQDELYAANAVSIEPDGAPNPRTEGIEAIKKKGEEFDQMVEKVYSSSVSEPLIADRFITMTFIMDTEFKGMGRVDMEEVGVYEVKDGKIVTEQFFYTPAPQG